MPEQSIEDRLRELGVVRYADFITAAGEPANQKLEMDVLHNDAELYKEVMGRLALLASDMQADLLVSVPTGANPYVETMSDAMKVPFVQPTKNPDTKKFSIPNNVYARSPLVGKKRIVLADDVFTTGSSALRLASLPELRGKVMGLVTVWDRSDPDVRLRLPFRRASVVKSYIPLLTELPAEQQTVQ